MFADRRLKKAIDINNLIAISISKTKDIDIKENEKITLLQDSKISILDILLSNLNNATDELYITTFRVGKKELIILDNLLKNGYIKKLTLLISDSIRQMTPASYNLIKDLNIKFKEINTHTKMMFLKNKNGVINCFSSGNFNPDGKIEQLTLDNNKNTFEFYKNWIESL